MATENNNPGLTIMDRQTLAMILGILGGICGFIVITTLVLVNLMFADLIKNYLGEAYLKYHLLAIILSCFVGILAFLFIVASALLFIGAKTKRSSYLLPWMVLDLLLVLVNMVLINHYFSIFAMIVITVLELFFWAQVAVLYQDLKGDVVAPV
jgi:hypothetical protein